MTIPPISPPTILHKPHTSIQYKTHTYTPLRITKIYKTTQYNYKNSIQPHRDNTQFINNTNFTNSLFINFLPTIFFFLYFTTNDTKFPLLIPYNLYVSLRQFIRLDCGQHGEWRLTRNIQDFNKENKSSLKMI